MNYTRLIIVLCTFLLNGCDADEGMPATAMEASDTPKELTINRGSDDQLRAYDQFFEENSEKHLGQVADLVAFPTLAMVPENAPDLEKAGQYLIDRLTEIGMDNAKFHPADGFPLVTAEWMNAEGQPTAVFYGHFDVQPVVASRWDSDPFKAEVRDNKMYGRGATDDKGYIIAFLSTLEALMELDGKLPVNVKILLDGAEEFGSQSMVAWLAETENNAWIREADFGFNLDAMMQSDDQGLMWRGLRGGGDVDVTVTSANTAVHSGIFGGIAPNAVHAQLPRSLLRCTTRMEVSQLQDSMTISSYPTRHSATR